MKEYKYLQLLSAFYITSALATLILANRVIYIWGIHTMGSALVVTLFFALADIITEVYGYAIMRKLTWITFICLIIFPLILEVINLLPQDPHYKLNLDYTRIISPLLLIALLAVAELIIGQFVNAYCLTKWRILLKGKYFWLRSVGSTIVGSFLMTFIGYLNKVYSLPLHKALLFIMVAYLLKLIFAIIYSTPSALVVSILKRIEPNIGSDDQYVSFNPFKLN